MLSRIKYFLSDYTNVIILLIFVTTFSGVLRKWGGLSSTFNNLFLLILMALPIYLLFFFKNEDTKNLKKILKNLLHIFLFTLTILAVHPLNLTYFHGLFGFLIHLSFIAIVLSYFKNRNTFNEKKFIRLFFIILATQLIIASIQYASPQDSIINRYADNRQETSKEIPEEEEFIQASAKVGDAVRVTGTFSYLGGYTAVVYFMLLFTFYLAKTKKSNYLFFLAPLIIYAALLSGSRSCVGFVLILLLVFIFTERKLLIKDPKPILMLLTGIGLLIVLSFSLGDFLGIIEKVQTAYDNFVIRVEGSSEESEGRLTADLMQVFTRDFEYKNIGVGLGSTYQGVKTLFGTSNIVQQTPLEGELFRLIVEGGIFYLLFRWLFLLAIFSFIEIPFVLKATLFLFFCVFSQNVFHIYNAIYFAVGLIILNQAYRKQLRENCA